MRWLAATLVGAVVASMGVALTLGQPAPAEAAAGSPGVPSAGAVLYSEDFEQGSGVTLLTNYPAAVGYTADPYWLSTRSCNGFIASAEITSRPAGYCASSYPGAEWSAVGAKAYALGLLNVPQNPGTNRAVSSNTAPADSSTVTPNLIQFATEGQLDLPSANGRFITFSVDAAATACGTSNSHPLLQFYLRDADGHETPVSTSPIDPCTDLRATSTRASNGVDVWYGRFAADGSTLVSTASIGVVMRNESSGASNGNDGAFDNIRILDVTPQLDKSFSPALVPTGGTSTLTFTITNTSELAAKNGWSFTDALPAGLTIADPAAATTTCSAGQVTATAGGTAVAVTGNLNTGQVSCTASVQVTAATTGTYSNGPANVTTTGLNPPGTATVTFEKPGITILKTAGTPVDVNRDGLTDEGDTIPYSFVVTNAGDVALTGVTVEDAKIAGVTCPASTLAVGASMTCAGTYTVTAADMTSGSVVNTATATGRSPQGQTVTSPPSSTTTPLSSPSPGLTLVKSADPSTVSAAGQSVTYSFAVHNSGNVPIQDVAITETAFTGSGTAPAVTCPPGTLAAGADTTCTASYVVTQADVDRGRIDNTATAGGVAVGGGSVVSSPSSATVTASAAPAISVVKSASPNSADAYTAGRQVTYSFVVRNTGNVTLTDATVDETSFSGTGTLSALDCPAGLASLAPDATVTCTATYTLTQADIDAGKVTNSATATGTPPTGAPVTSPPSDAVVPTPPSPALSLVKTADVQQISKVGQTVTFTFVVTNTGNVTITDPAIDETAFSGTGALSAITCPDGQTRLIPGQSVTCTATYQVTQADLDSGALTNTATATGTTPGGGPTEPSTPSTVVVPTDARPALTLVKKADRNTVSGAGQTITYRFTLTNTGNVTLRNLTVAEKEFSGTGTLSAVDCPAGIRSIAPGESVTCTATYVTTAADVKAGRVSNTAVAAGDPAPGGDRVSSGPSRYVVSIQAGGVLAFTGSTVAWPVALGAIALIAGGAGVLLSRRRRQA